MRRFISFLLALLLLLVALLPCAVAEEAKQPYTQYAAYNGYAVIEADQGQGLVRCLDGMVVLPPVYDFVTFYSHGTVRAVQDGKWGLFDGNGKQLLAPVYDYISAPTRGGYSFYTLDDYCGFIKDTYLLTEPVYSLILENGMMGDPWVDGFYRQHLGFTDEMMAEGVPVPGDIGPWEDIVWQTDYARTDGWDVADLSFLVVDPEGKSRDEFVAFLSNIYRNTRWGTLSENGCFVPLNNLRQLTVDRHFEQGIMHHHYDPTPQPGTADRDTGYVLYMNPYGELLQAVPTTVRDAWMLWNVFH